MKEKKVYRTASLLESNEKRLLEAYSESGRTCGIGVFAGELIALGLELHKELNRRRLAVIHAVAGDKTTLAPNITNYWEYRLQPADTGVKATIIPFPGRA